MKVISEDGEATTGGAELVAPWLAQRASGGTETIWIDVGGEEAEGERRWLTETFGVTTSTSQTLFAPRHPPKLEAFDDHLFLLLRGLASRSDSIAFGTIQIGVLFGERWLFTRHVEVSPSTDGAWAEVERRPTLLADGPAAVALRLSRRLADRYLPIVLNLEARLEEIEEEMFDTPGDRLLEELLVYKRQLKRLRRIASYHVSAFGNLKNAELPMVPDALEHRVNEVWGQMERIASLSALYNDLANDLMNGYLSLSSHRLNNIMKVLTIVTVIFVPLTFIAGIYGMNFEYIPELGVRSGYFFVLGAMAVITVFLLFLFLFR